MSTTSATRNEWILRWLRSEFLQRENSTKNNEKILQVLTSDFTTSNNNEWVSTSNEQRVKSYTSKDT